jgi:hypothetical protein
MKHKIKKSKKGSFQLVKFGSWFECIWVPA